MKRLKDGPRRPPKTLSACAASRSWKRARERMEVCKTEASGLLYGAKGPQEFFRPSHCGYAAHGCRSSPVEKRVKSLAEWRRMSHEARGTLAFEPVRCAGRGLVNEKCYRGTRGGLLTLTFFQRDPLTIPFGYVHGFELLARLLKWLKDHGASPGRFVAVKEAHKSGFCHLHVVTEHFPHEQARIEQRKNTKTREFETLCAIDAVDGKTTAGKPVKLRIRDEWVRLGGGYRVSWEEIKSDAGYIAKYVEKPEAMPAAVRALLTVQDRRIWTSSPGLIIDPPRSDWEVFRGHSAPDLKRRMRERVLKRRSEMASGPPK